jgi:excisionase family DNA binding protein
MKTKVNDSTRVVMSATADRDFFTVAEAAKLLEVSTATVWRWINAGRLSSYRIGPKAVRIKRADLEEVIQPARARREGVSTMRDTTSIQTELVVEPLTDEEIQRGLQAMREARRLRERMRRERGGQSLPSSVELIREMREERSKHLDEL